MKWNVHPNVLGRMRLSQCAPETELAKEPAKERNIYKYNLRPCFTPWVWYIRQKKREFLRHLMPLRALQAETPPSLPQKSLKECEFKWCSHTHLLLHKMKQPWNKSPIKTAFSNQPVKTNSCWCFLYSINIILSFFIFQRLTQTFQIIPQWDKAKHPQHIMLTPWSCHCWIPLTLQCWSYKY